MGASGTTPAAGFHVRKGQNLDLVDTHVHYWKSLGGAVAGEMGPPLSYEQALATATESGVDHVICVTPRLMGFDNSYSLEGAHAYPTTFRVMGRFDHSVTDIERSLRELMSDPFMIGIRVSFIQPSAWHEDAEVNGLWGVAERLGVPIALYVPHQAPQIERLLVKHPNLRLIVDHMTLRHSDPTTAFEQWSDVLALSKWPRLAVKISGLIDAVTEKYPFPRAQRYLGEVCERFGAERVMWGSNFPPVLKFCSYADSVNFVREGCDFLNPDERANILGGAANRFFGLSWTADR
jgi:L-fuconolactonase